MLGDFQDNSSKHSLEQTITRLQELNTVIFSLMDLTELLDNKRGRKEGQTVARKLARATGGGRLRFRITS